VTNGRVVVTNDDGIDSPGLHALARCAVEAGWTVQVAAPHAEASGVGTGLVSYRERGKVPVTRRELPGLPGIEAYAVHAYPAMAALIGCGGGLGPRPDLLLSGINRGGNVSRAVMHSGTVGAALTAGRSGVTALAVSLDVLGADEPAHWDTACAAVAGLLPWLAGLPAGSVLNLNVPNVPDTAADPGPPVWAPLADPGNRHTQVAAPLADGAVDVRTLPAAAGPAPGSDAELLNAGRSVLTALRPVSTDDELMRHPLPGPGDGPGRSA
jgi:5'-nucleotidase